jgi:Putative prokaryotic signal transducing protein
VSLVELARYGTRVEADLARLALEAEDIDAIIFDAEANSFFGGGGLIGVRLMVLEEDFEDAVAILRADGGA